MNPLFQISPADIIPSETNFFAEVSSEGLSFFFQKIDNKMITGLSVFNFSKKNTVVNTAGILNKIFADNEFLKEPFNQKFITYSYNESILTPAVYYSENHHNEDLNLIFGDLYPAIVFKDYVAEKNIYNIYRIPDEVHQVITNEIGPVTHFHQYSLLCKQLKQLADELKVIFYPNKIVISLQKEGKLQIIQSYVYKTAEDVVYHTLNVCEQFDAKHFDIQLCGMIEKDSLLYKELEKYFLHIKLSELPGELLYSDEIKEFPSHFFSHLFAFALCV